MRHHKKTKILDRKKGQRTALFRTQAVSLIKYKHITTTTAKAKIIRSLVERLITKAKVGDLAARRQLLKQLDNETAVTELIENIAPKLKKRNGGYIRITRIEKDRVGDGAKTTKLEILDQE